MVMRIIFIKLIFRVTDVKVVIYVHVELEVIDSDDRLSSFQVGVTLNQLELNFKLIVRF